MCHRKFENYNNVQSPVIRVPTFQSPKRPSGNDEETKIRYMQFMLNGALALIEESEHLRDDYESMKAMLHPDQRMIIEFRHNFLHLVLRIFEPILSIRKPSKCGNVVEIEANIRHLLS